MDENTKFSISEYRDELYYGRRKRISSGLSKKSETSKSQKKLILTENNYFNYKSKKQTGQS